MERHGSPDNRQNLKPYSVTLRTNRSTYCGHASDEAQEYERSEESLVIPSDGA